MVDANYHGDTTEHDLFYDCSWGIDWDTLNSTDKQVNYCTWCERLLESFGKQSENDEEIWEPGDVIVCLQDTQKR